MRIEAENRLIKKYPSTTYGVWHILGEDTSCGEKPRCKDFGFWEGFYSHIVSYALTLPDFFVYGNGGTIEKVEVKKLNEETINKIERKRLLLREREKIEKEIKELNV